MNNISVPAVIQQAAKDLRIDIDPTKVNLLLPTETYGQVIGQFDKVTLEVIHVDPDPKHGEVYEISGKKALAKIPLQKISDGLCIIWEPNHTTSIAISPTKVKGKAFGAMRKPNGEWLLRTDEKVIDLEVIEEELRTAKEEDAEKGPIVDWKENERGKKYPVRGKWSSEPEKLAWIEREVKKALLQKKKFINELALTGAKERVIREFVALKASYADDELRKPFVFPRVTLDANKLLADPEFRQAALDRMSSAVTNIFGPGNGSHRERNITPGRQAIAEDVGLEIPESEVHEVQEEPLPTFEAPEAPPQEESKDQIIRRRLQEYVDDPKYSVLGKAKSPAGKSARDLVVELLARSDATLDELAEMDARVQDYLAKVGGGVA